ncbi:MAG: hypothetical protein KGS61_10610 [Verrucomicrobia bacterium]|nr:hypothetical protein [Verrucomicrobiota bacterium]
MRSRSPQSKGWLPGRSRLLLTLISSGALCAGRTAYAQVRDSLAGESAAEALKKSMSAEDYNLRYGPVLLKTGASLGLNYTDNAFYSHTPKQDFMIDPEATLDGLWQITELNSLRLSLGLSYERYLENQILNSDVPLVNPGSELAFNVFVGDFRIRLHERFSYQEDLFFNSLFGNDASFYNLNNVGIFARLDNQVGFDADWDLNKVVLSVGYNHEDFDTSTAPLEYLNRQSDWFTASASFDLGDKAKAGVEDQAGLHSYHHETVLNDNWRNRAGPFVEVTLPQKITMRAGGGLDLARYVATGFNNNDYTTYYGYARISQETRFFSHSLAAGREHLLGDLANNLRTTYVRYSIDSPILRNLDLGANLSFNQGEEFGGAYDEKFTYYAAGLHVGYQFHKYWRADLTYEFRRKESNVPLLPFYRDVVSLTASYSF